MITPWLFLSEYYLPAHPYLPQGTRGYVPAVPVPYVSLCDSNGGPRTRREDEARQTNFSEIPWERADERDSMGGKLLRAPSRGLDRGLGRGHRQTHRVPPAVQRRGKIDKPVGAARPPLLHACAFM